MSLRKERIIKPHILTEQELKAEEEEIDGFGLKQKVKVKDVILKTMGDLRPFIKSTKIARKFENFLHEDDFDYIYNWILHKELKD